MKKAVSLILILVMCLSFCACGENQNQGTNSIYEKYTLLLELLEAGDFAAARLELDRLEGVANGGSLEVTTRPTESGPSIIVPNFTLPPVTVPPTTTEPKPTEALWQTVEITLDNFYDYFKPIQVLNVERNGFGELERVNLFTYFVPRDGLTVDDNQSKLALRYWYEMCEYPLVTDEATGEISLGEAFRYPNSSNYMATEDFRMGHLLNGEYTYHLYAAGAFTYSPEDTTIGTICMEYLVLTEVLGTVQIKGEPTDERFDGMIAQG